MRDFLFVSAVGVSGGPDSMALCVLTASWKSSGKNENSAFVDGLLGIVVDHKLRPESTDEANLVCSRVLNLGKRRRIDLVLSRDMSRKLSG